jgi:hypothetical protein
MPVLLQANTRKNEKANAMMYLILISITGDSQIEVQEPIHSALLLLVQLAFH